MPPSDSMPGANSQYQGLTSCMGWGHIGQVLTAGWGKPQRDPAEKTLQGESDWSQFCKAALTFPKQRPWMVLLRFHVWL